MTNKQKLIIDYLTDHNGQGYYYEIRDNIVMQFDNEDDFHKTLYQLADLYLIYKNGALYKLTFPELKVEYSIPHVTLFYTDKNVPQLRIEDTELFDTFDDILTERFNIVDYSHSTENIKDLKVYTIYFQDKISKEKLNEAVKSLDQEEVERIFKMNNPNEKKLYHQ